MFDSPFAQGGGGCVASTPGFGLVTRGPQPVRFSGGG
jgi:hypothetical protein